MPHRTSFKAAPEYDTGERWIIFWETRRPESGEWSQAVEKSEAAAVERARHLIKLGFIVFQIAGPAGVFLDEAEIARRFQPPVAAKRLRAPDEPPPTVSL
ncbi:MAG TPA: hypothetical protein VGR79_04485 [Stellaceae bacterium]|nr:hypothetical protein [Stellaceae bacterium]